MPHERAKSGLGTNQAGLGAAEVARAAAAGRLLRQHAEWRQNVRMACAKGVSRGGVPPEHQPAVAAARRRGGRTLRGLSEPVGGEGSSRKLILPDLEPCTFRVGSSGSRATGPEGARRTRPGRPTEPRSGLRHARWAG